MSSLRITEIFYSLQGESNTVGIPTVFIRLTGCPLRCVYCDTAYAFTGGKKISINEIIAEVEQYNTPYITVTGGEPLAQAACNELLVELVNKDFKVSLETSGAIEISNVNQRVIKVMDLKTPSSGELNKNLYTNIQYLNSKDQVKFVISNDEDYNWSKTILTEYELTNRCEVLFSPVMGIQNPTELAEKILRDRLPVRFQIQLHKLLWNDAQGK
ncbi:MAG: 7-carboxy-7-deazaguanine synthase QueE [Methylococcales bacterium]|nr:MAG: 7-carboxy-7-deazaguanine synthase QueE [Methylococcales bacterium]